MTMSEHLRQFLDSAGFITASIYALSLWMWVLILERYRCLAQLERGLAQSQPAPDATRRLHRPRIARRLHAQRVADVAVAARRHLPLIRALVHTLPLLGLLGTVSGLVQCFEGIALLGENNRRAVASGIAQALIATLSGLLTALSGLYFSVDLDQRATRLRNDAEREAVLAGQF